ncbi:LacI family DNA-binding transcriptional regulator [Christensenella intestinihominis]|uniref:LacI family DNA-binding transcriptional regulator n=1 Tax=Christensenella intestinihominis TaxID=1851429 RepID=UPI00083562D7|nr:LacI family DNA-binding transcriptional regulator [Christensenella intestinihominis]
MSEMSKPAATLKDVALRSGYALRTVKKVMNGDTSVREKTREAVLRAANELNYKKNRLASALAQQKSVKVAIVYSKVTKTYFPEIKEGFLQFTEEFKDFGLSIEISEIPVKGWQYQYQVLEKLLCREDIDGVILQPTNTTKLNDIIHELTANGKPVITFGADAPASDRICYVGPDAYRAGRIGGQLLANYIGKKGNVCVVMQTIEHMQTIYRKHGFTDYLQEHCPKISISELTIADDSGLYVDTVHNFLKENDDFSGIFCTDANTYLIGEMIRETRKKDVKLVGFDLSAEAIELMKQEYIDVIIDQKPKLFSYAALETMFRYLYNNEQPVKKIIHTDLSILTSECFNGLSL